MISSSQKPLPGNTQHTCPYKFRTHNIIRRVATEPRLRPLGHWVQQFVSDRLSNIVLRMVGLISLLFDVHVKKGEK